MEQEQPTVEIQVFKKTYYILADNMPSDEEEKQKYIERLENKGKSRLYYYAKHHPE